MRLFRPAAIVFVIASVLALAVLVFATSISAQERTPQWLFFVKMLFVITGIATMVLIRRQVYGARTEPVTVPASVRGLAALSLVAWVAAITAGRLLAYVN